VLTLEPKYRAEDPNLAQPVKPLSTLEIEIIDLFVQFSRILGHPCKIYSVLGVGAPVLYIGPWPSHVSEIFDALNNELACAWCGHGDVEEVVREIKSLRGQTANAPRHGLISGRSRFAKEALLPMLIKEFEAG
jgi:hypothetical protein